MAVHQNNPKISEIKNAGKIPVNLPAPALPAEKVILQRNNLRKELFLENEKLQQQAESWKWREDRIRVALIVCASILVFSIGGYVAVALASKAVLGYMGATTLTTIGSKLAVAGLASVIGAFATPVIGATIRTIFNIVENFSFFSNKNHSQACLDSKDHLIKTTLSKDQLVEDAISGLGAGVAGGLGKFFKPLKEVISKYKSWYSFGSGGATASASQAFSSPLRQLYHKNNLENKLNQHCDENNINGKARADFIGKNIKENSLDAVGIVSTFSKDVSQAFLSGGIGGRFELARINGTQTVSRLSGLKVDVGDFASASAIGLLRAKLDTPDMNYDQLIDTTIQETGNNFKSVIQARYAVNPESVKIPKKIISSKNSDGFDYQPLITSLELVIETTSRNREIDSFLNSHSKPDSRIRKQLQEVITNSVISILKNPSLWILDVYLPDVKKLAPIIDLDVFKNPLVQKALKTSLLTAVSDLQGETTWYLYKLIKENGIEVDLDFKNRIAEITEVTIAKANSARAQFDYSDKSRDNQLKFTEFDLAWCKLIKTLALDEERLVKNQISHLYIWVHPEYRDFGICDSKQHWESAYKLLDELTKNSQCALAVCSWLSQRDDASILRRAKSEHFDERKTQRYLKFVQDQDKFYIEAQKRLGNRFIFWPSGMIVLNSPYNHYFEVDYLSNIFNIEPRCFADYNKPFLLQYVDCFGLLPNACVAVQAQDCGLHDYVLETDRHGTMAPPPSYRGG